MHGIKFVKAGLMLMVRHWIEEVSFTHTKMGGSNTQVMPEIVYQVSHKCNETFISIPQGPKLMSVQIKF